MPLLQIYVDDRTMAILTEYGERHARSVEDLAGAAVAEEAMRCVPPQARGQVARTNDLPPGHHLLFPGEPTYGKPE